MIGTCLLIPAALAADALYLAADLLSRVGDRLARYTRVLYERRAAQ